MTSTPSGTGGDIGEISATLASLQLRVVALETRSPTASQWAASVVTVADLSRRVSLLEAVLPATVVPPTVLVTVQNRQVVVDAWSDFARLTLGAVVNGVYSPAYDVAMRRMHRAIMLAFGFTDRHATKVYCFTVFTVTFLLTEMVDLKLFRVVATNIGMTKSCCWCNPLRLLSHWLWCDLLALVPLDNLRLL